MNLPALASPDRPSVVPDDSITYVLMRSGSQVLRVVSWKSAASDMFWGTHVANYIPHGASVPNQSTLSNGHYTQYVSRTEMRI